MSCILSSKIKIEDPSSWFSRKSIDGIHIKFSIKFLSEICTTLLYYNLYLYHLQLKVGISNSLNLNFRLSQIFSVPILIYPVNFVFNRKCFSRTPAKSNCLHFALSSFNCTFVCLCKRFVLIKYINKYRLLPLIEKISSTFLRRKR